MSTSSSSVSFRPLMCLRVCVGFFLPPLYLILFPRTTNKHERNLWEGKVYVSVCIWWFFYVVVQLPVSSSAAQHRSVSLTFPTSCYQLAPSNRGCLLLHSPSDFSRQFFYCAVFHSYYLNLPFFQCMGHLKLTEVYTPHLFPSLILFIGLDKYLDLEGDVLS